MFTKRCCVCNKNVPTTEFAQHPLTADGLTPNCKSCGGVDITDYLTFCVETPIKRFDISAAAIVNRDSVPIEYLIGKLEGMNPSYIVALKRMAEMAGEAIEKYEQCLKQPS